MAGRIKLLNSGVKVNDEDTAVIDYAYDEPGKFDKTCGTFNLDDFTLPQSFCPSAFVCETHGASADLKSFSECIDAMNCHMFADMTTNIVPGPASALFIHQMLVPHHQNAVNIKSFKNL